MWRAYRETVEFVDERQVGADVTVVVTNVDERLKQVGGKHSLEVSTIPFHAEQEAQSSQGVRLSTAVSICTYSSVHTHTQCQC